MFGSISPAGVASLSCIIICVDTVPQLANPGIGPNVTVAVLSASSSELSLVCILKLAVPLDIVTVPDSAGDVISAVPLPVIE